MCAKVLSFTFLQIHKIYLFSEVIHSTKLLKKIHLHHVILFVCFSFYISLVFIWKVYEINSLMPS